MVVTLPEKHIKTQMGMDLVAFHRATSRESFKIWYDEINGVTIGDLSQLVMINYLSVIVMKTYSRSKQIKHRLDLFHK